MLQLGTRSAHYLLARPRRFERPTIAAGAPNIQLSKIRPVAAGGRFVYSGG